MSPIIESFWKAAVTACGLGALATFLLWSLYSRWLTLPILAKFTKKQLFHLFLVFLILTFLFASLALGLYGWLQTQEKAALRHSKGELIESLRAREADFSSAMQALQTQIQELQKEKFETEGRFIRQSWPREFGTPPERVLPNDMSNKEIDEFASTVKRLNQQRIHALESDNLSLYHDLSNSINDLKVKYQMAAAQSKEQLQHFREMVIKYSVLDPRSMASAEASAASAKVRLTQEEGFLNALKSVMNADNDEGAKTH